MVRSSLILARSRVTLRAKWHFFFFSLMTSFSLWFESILLRCFSTDFFRRRSQSSGRTGRLRQSKYSARIDTYFWDLQVTRDLGLVGQVGQVIWVFSLLNLAELSWLRVYRSLMAPSQRSLSLSAVMLPVVLRNLTNSSLSSSSSL
jgi:hypothetical protein